MKGKRRKGTQMKRWEDSYKEWRGIDFASLIFEEPRPSEEKTRGHEISRNDGSKCQCTDTCT